MVVARGWGKKLVFNGDSVSVWDNENVLEMDCRDGCTTR
jgi:hypothetical protein